MPTASTAALSKRRLEKKAAAEKHQDEATAKEEAEKKQKCKITLVRNSHSAGKSAAEDKDSVARSFATPVAAGGRVIGAQEPAPDDGHIELNTINVVGGRILTTRRSGGGDDNDEVVAMERARKRLAEEGEDVAASAKGLNVDADEKLFADLEKLDVSATQIMPEVPSGTSKSMYRDRDPVPSLEDFQPAPMWTEEPMTLVSNPRLDSRLKHMLAVEYGEDGVESYPFDTFERYHEQHWKDLKRLGYL